MIRIAMPKIPETMIHNPEKQALKGYWTSRCKTNYKKLNSNLKSKFEILLNKILNLQDIDMYGPHQVKLKGAIVATNAHLEPNISATSDTSNKSKSIKHKGAYLILYSVIEIEGSFAILVLDVGDHSILKNDSSDFR